MGVQKIKENSKPTPTNPNNYKKEITKLKLEMEQFMAAIATGKAPDSVVRQITDRESRIGLLETELEKYKIHIYFSEFDNKRLEKKLADRLSLFREQIPTTTSQSTSDAA